MSPVIEVEGYCLRWNNHHRTLIDVLQSLYQEQSFVDVTLAAEGKSLQVHRLVLCAVSPYFQELLSTDCDKQAIIFLKDIPFLHLQALVHYMYNGEVNIAEDQLADLLNTAESLQIKGLTDSDCKMNNIEQRNSDELAESLRLNQIGPTEPSESTTDSCEVTATLVNPSPTLASMPFLATTSSPSLNHTIQQPIYTTQANGDSFVKPKLETDGSAASENEEWSESDLTAPGTPAAVATFGTTTSFPHVPWGESLAAAAAAAIASTSTIAGPSVTLGTYNIQPQDDPAPAITPVRGKQRNSRRPTRPPNNSTTTTLIQDKPYVCPRCGRCYSRRGALIQHQRYECGIEPQFSCPMCPYKIKRKDSLNRHIRNMHHNQNSSV